MRGLAVKKVSIAFGCLLIIGTAVAVVVTYLDKGHYQEVGDVLYRTDGSGQDLSGIYTGYKSGTAPDYPLNHTVVFQPGLFDYSQEGNFQLFAARNTSYLGAYTVDGITRRNAKQLSRQRRTLPI